MTRHPTTLYAFAFAIVFIAGCQLVDKSERTKMDDLRARYALVEKAPPPMPFARMDDARSVALVVVVPKPRKTFYLSLYLDGVTWAKGYELGIGTNSGQYFRIIPVGTNSPVGATGLPYGVTHYIAARGVSQVATSAWSPELVWPQKFTNTVTVTPGSEITTSLTRPNWQPMPTNVLYNPVGRAFFRGKGSTKPISISSTDNVRRYQHAEQ